MKATERTLQQLLHSPDQYVIPVFQRYYTWKAGNWDQLVDDVSALLEPGAESRRHFMGSIVTVPNGHQPGSVPAYQVIDGQQRLTTLSILLCVIRDVAAEQGWQEMVAEVDENYLVHRFKKGSERYKVYPRQRDRASYLALVDKKVGVASGQIEAAHQVLLKRVAQLAQTEAILRAFFSALTTRLDFVAITLGAENPYKIFRSLNSTGVDLAEADLIRNHVFMSMHVDDQDVFDDEHWRVLESHFTADNKLVIVDFEAFLRDTLMRDGTYIGRDGTFEAFEKRFPAGKFDPVEVVTDLVKVAKQYNIVRGAEKHSDAGVQEALAGIKSLNVSTAYPLLTLLLERHRDGVLTRDELLVSLRGLASFVLRRYVCVYSSRAYSTWFVTACKEPAVPASSVLTFLAGKGVPSDDEFKAKFVRFGLYESKYDKAVLRVLESELQVASEPVVLDGCSIEHVMPQTIDEHEDDGKAWIACLGTAWKSLHAEWLHTPGNLTLVGADYNSGMSNRPFTIKKPVLSESKVYLNHHFKPATLTAWTAVEIESRANAMAERAAVLWPSIS